MRTHVSTGLRRLGWRGGVAAGLTLASAAVVIAVLVIPTAAFGRGTCAPSGKRLSITSFDPPFAKAGSDTVVHVDGSHLNYVRAVAIGPKGQQTWTGVPNFVNGGIEFTVPPGAVSGPITVVDCNLAHSARSRSDLRV